VQEAEKGIYLCDNLLGGEEIAIVSNLDSHQLPQVSQLLAHYFAFLLADGVKDF